MVKAVIFDMDGVIVDSMPIHYPIWEEVAKKFGIDMNRDIFDDLNGMDTPRIAEILVEKYSLDVSPGEISRVKRSIAGERLEGGVRIFDGVGDTIFKLKQIGLKIGLATMTPRDHVEKTLGSNLDKLCFDTIITDSDVMRPKPEPDIFMKCAECLGVPYSECIVVEDALNGVKAAKKAGMKVVAITNTTKREKFQADAIIDDIRELPGIIQTVFQK